MKLSSAAVPTVGGEDIVLRTYRTAAGIGQLAMQQKLGEDR